MKECPICSRVYADDSLRFCLDDGAKLLARNAAQPTLRIKSPALPTQRAEVLPNSKPSGPPQRSLIPWVVAGVAVLLAGVVVLTSLVVVIANRTSSNVTPTPTPLRTASATPTPESTVVNLAGTHWHDTTTMNISTKAYYFNPNGTINGNSSDTWRQDGRTVVLEFTNGYARYDGTINGDQIDYKARNTVNLEWSATLIRDR